MTSSFLRSKQRGWRSRWSFVAASAGATVGLGNLWKFSYLAGDNGGAAFILAYVGCLLFVALPVVIAEVVIGRRGRANPISSMHDICLEVGAGPVWKCIGILGCITGILILSYYAVIAGWGLAYIGKMFMGELAAASVSTAGAHFSVLLEQPLELIKWQSLFLSVVVLVSMLGAKRGIAVMARLMIPILFIFLLALALYSSQLGDMDAALAFMFRPDFDAFTINTLLVALGHAFFSLTIGVGVMLVFGGYSPDKRPVTNLLGTVAVMDISVSLLAGLAIFPLVFSLKLAPSMGPGLMFIAVPYSFGNMAYGHYFGALFFTIVSMVALTSAVAMLEPATTWLSERFRWWRPAAAACIGLLVWLLGLVSIFSFNIWQDIQWQGMSLFALLDFFTANILLPLSGLLIAIFVGWIMRREVVRDELIHEWPWVFKSWYGLLRYVAVVGVIMILVSSLYHHWPLLYA